MNTAETTTKAIDEKASGVRKKRRIAKQKGPKLHRLKKESTKTITNRLYKAWAELVRYRAGRRCIVCGREGTSSAPLNAHHIMPRQMFSGLRFDEMNGACLCPKCHKMGKFSAHKGGIWFAEWLRLNKPVQYDYCVRNMQEELDCKDRLALYRMEQQLHEANTTIIGQLPVFKVKILGKDGTEHLDIVQGHNAKAAEFIVWNRLIEYGHKLKGILKTEAYSHRDEPGKTASSTPIGK